MVTDIMVMNVVYVANIYNLDRRYKMKEGLNCNFCGVFVESEDGSAFSDGTLYSNFGYDDRVACSQCCGNIKFSEDCHEE